MLKDNKDPETQRLLSGFWRANDLYADCSPTCTGWIEAVKDYVDDPLYS
jgi:hypothetical protein